MRISVLCVSALVVPAFLALAGCATDPMATSGAAGRDGEAMNFTQSTQLLSPEAAAKNFMAAAHRMEPVIEDYCRHHQLAQTHSCDFRIMVDDRPDPEPNAFQTLDEQGRPVLAFNLTLISQAINQDELAFVMGHEAAHHILGHLALKADDSETGAVLMGTIIASQGASNRQVRQAQHLGAEMGALTRAKDYEMKADSLGTVLAYRAGYSPIRGAQFFKRISDPEQDIFSSHPSNRARMANVRATMRAIEKKRVASKV
ncbi:M48 family metallopeptidase [Thioclava sp. GXIMD4216]|uniref:M48 family metallopeptidase n=1 Tax=unclassified Thioclava TaxID=2621713 RepID=UPI0030CC5DC2